MLKKVIIKIETVQQDVETTLFADNAVSDEAKEENQNGFILEKKDPSSKIEMVVEGKLKNTLGVTELKYQEPDDTGMESTSTNITFNDSNPQVITMMRSGTVSSALVFEEGKRNISVYTTPFMPFEVCVHTIKVENTLLSDGKLFLDYFVEIRGATAERCKINISFKEQKKHSLPKEN